MKNILEPGLFESACKKKVLNTRYINNSSIILGDPASQLNAVHSELDLLHGGGRESHSRGRQLLRGHDLALHPPEGSLPALMPAT